MKHGKIIVTLAIVVFAVVSCSYENTATVTIDTGIRQQANLSLFDRVLAWLTFAKPVTADPAPDWLEKIEINVTAPDIGTITSEIPLDTGKITLEIPAGNQRTFEVVGYDSDNYRFCGGITTVDLQPGEVELTIEMGKLTSINAAWNSSESKVEIQYSRIDNPAPIYFKVYKYITGASETYTLIDVVRADSLPFIDYTEQINYYYTHPEINSDNRLYYYISAVNQYGEGEKVQIY